jgi:hypothetical protein
MEVNVQDDRFVMADKVVDDIEQITSLSSLFMKYVRSIWRT